MDVLTPEEIQQHTQDDPSFEDKYNRRTQRGDVLEVAEDGRWLDHQHGNGRFLIARVPFLSVEQAEEYVTELVDADGIETKRRRYRLWFETLTEEDMKTYEIAPYVYQVDTLEDLLLFGQDKFDES